MFCKDVVLAVIDFLVWVEVHSAWAGHNAEQSVKSSCCHCTSVPVKENSLEQRLLISLTSFLNQHGFRR